jgi:hypothetical protein
VDVNVGFSRDRLVGPLDDENVDVCALHLQRTSGAPLVFDRAYQLVTPGLLVDLDADGDLDVLGERLAFNRTGL